MAKSRSQLSKELLKELKTEPLQFRVVVYYILILTAIVFVSQIGLFLYTTGP